MSTALFTGRAEAKRPDQPVSLPEHDRARQLDPAGYLPDPGLVDAVNVALMLGQPLLLTGDPGTGKTQLAYRVAWELGFAKPLLFETKSTSTARDLFYTYDSLRRFHAAHTPQASQDNRDYITYSALGLAILYANDPAAVQRVLPPDFKHPGRRRSVVLIDEVDKAPRDFPNDVLNEIEHMYFRIPELNNARVGVGDDQETDEQKFKQKEGMRPIVLITSNSEKNLPDPFLRRCIYYHIPFPDRGRLAKIIQKRLASFKDPTSPLLTSALDFFEKLRQRNLRKSPSTAELINWLSVLARNGVAPNQRLDAARPQVEASLSALIKAQEDLEEAKRVVAEFCRAE